ALHAAETWPARSRPSADSPARAECRHRVPRWGWPDAWADRWWSHTPPAAGQAIRLRQYAFSSLSFLDWMSLAICRPRYTGLLVGKLAYRNIAFAAPGPVHDLADQLSAGCIDIIPPRGAHGHVVTGVVQHILEPPDSIVAGPLVSRIGEGVEGNEVDLARRLTQQLDQLLSMFRLVVHILQQGVLNGQITLLAQPGDIPVARRQQYRQRVLPVQRHQLVAQFIVGRMQRQGQGHIGNLAKLLD